MVATVIIVVVFMISSLILNTVFGNAINNKTRAIEAHLNETTYLYFNGKLELPYINTFENWEISTNKFIEKEQAIIEFEAINSITNKKITREYFEKK